MPKFLADKTALFLYNTLLVTTAKKKPPYSIAGINSYMITQ